MNDVRLSLIVAVIWQTKRIFCHQYLFVSIGNDDFFVNFPR